MKIEISFKKLTNGKLAGLVGHTLQSINISNEPELIGHEKVVALNASYENYKTALSKRTYNRYTREMSNCFKTLSKSFADFKRHANFLTYSSDDKEVQLGEQVKKHLSSLGRSWNRMRKSDQSAYIHNILTEFGKAEYTDMMGQTTLNIKLEVMQTAVEAYDTVVTSCINDRVEIKALGSATALRALLIDDYKKVYSYVQGLGSTTDQAKWQLLIDQFNQYYQDELSKKRTKSSSGKNTTSTDTNSTASDATK